jgi:predicted NBD/HSP70 family sugar kinase
MDIRRHNRNAILTYIFETTGTSKLEISNALRISMPTVQQNTNELLEIGIITQGGLYQSNGGRKAVKLQPQANFKFSLGIDILNTQIRMIVLDLEANEVTSKRIWIDYVNDTSYYESLGKFVMEFLEENAIPFDKIIGASFSIPGTISNDETIITESSSLKIFDLSCSRFSQFLPWNSIFMTDSFAAGIIEHHFAQFTDNVVYLSVSQRVGGAIFINGKLYKGLHNRSGNFGHICLIPEGEKCLCGRLGCAEAYCSTSVLLDKLSISSLEQFFLLLTEGDKNALAEWDDFLYHLALLIVNVWRSFDCNIIIGGLIGRRIEPWFSRLKEFVKKIDPENNPDDFLCLCKIRTLVSARGAALHLIKQFLADF